MDGELYLVREGSQSPLRLGQFVQLRAAPRNAQYTTYFYNRTEGTSVRMVSYQHGPAERSAGRRGELPRGVRGTGFEVMRPEPRRGNE